MFAQRQMRTGTFVICAIDVHQAQQPRRREHDDVIEAVPTCGADESFGVRILPGRAGGNEGAGEKDDPRIANSRLPR